MQKHNSGIRKHDLRLAMLFFFGLIIVAGMMVAATPVQAGVCGMVVTPTGEDEFWPCPNQPNVPQAPPEPDVWGAIAVSPTSLVWGSSWNYDSMEEAESNALKQCQSTSEGKDCKIALNVADVCVALVMSLPENIYVTGGPTGATNFATGNAMLKCKRAGGKACAVITSFCADGINHVLKGSTSFSHGNPVFTPSGQSSSLRRQ